jgi:STE24 endopeptidase
MEYAFWIIIILYALNQGADLVLELLNYQHLSKYGADIPPEFAGAIDTAQFTRSRDYNMAKSRFNFFSRLYNQIIILIFIFGLINFYNEWILGWRINDVLHGVVFFLLLIYAKAILNFPFNLYRLFVLDRRFGFSTITFKVWFTDQIKSFILSTIILGGALAGMFWLVSFEYTRNIWWLPVWCVFFLVTVFVVYISPNLIQPLFNKFIPLNDRDLNHHIKLLLDKCGVRVSGVYTMDASRRTLISQAYFTGLGNRRRIVIYDTLVSKLNQDELLAVLAHEAAHTARKHVAKNLLVLGMLSLIGTIVSFIVLRHDWLGQIFNLEHSTFYSQLVLLSFVSSILCCGLPLLLNTLSRHFERQADRFVVKLMGSGEALANALVKLSVENLSSVNPQRVYASFNSSHPAMVSRVRKLRHFYGAPK